MKVNKRLVAILVVVAMFFGIFSAVPVNLVSAAGGPFIMAYHTTGTSGTNMTYMDDSLHLAYSTDGASWIPLNDNNGILFKKNTSGGVSDNLQFRNPFLFKKQDGTYVLLATTTSNKGETVSTNICAWDSTDLLNYTNERVITTNTVAQIPQCKYDSASGNYIVYWTDGTKKYSAATADFSSALTGTQYTGTEYPSVVPATLSPSLKATPGSVITVSQSELDRLKSDIGTPAVPTGTKDISVTTGLNTSPVLPDTAEVQYSDGTSVQKTGITWESVDPSKLKKEGTFTVNGHINGTQDYINPLIKNGADPDIYKGPDGYYYYTSSYMDYSHNGVFEYQYDRITLRKASTIQGLATAAEKTIFTKYSSGDASAHIWAPEIHNIGGKWYIYFAGGKASAAFDLRAYVLECSGDPMTDTWGTPVGATGVAAGGPAKIAMQNEQFDLDATVFEFDGSMYMAWAYKYDSVPSSIRIAKMVNPYTLDSDQVTISGPEYTWERRYDKVMEAPTVLIKNGKIFMGYSAGSTDSTYAMGLLTASAAPGTNLLDPASWTKTPYPVMATSAENGQYGPGHYTFTLGEDGQNVVSYHARENQRYSEDGYAPLYDATRWARVQNLYWRDNGTPYFGVPARDGYLPGAGVKATVKVNASAGTVFLDETDISVRINDKKNVILRKANGDGTYEDLTASSVISSSDDSIAKVSPDGTIKGISEGTCVVSLVYGGKTYTANINVFKATAAPDLVLRYKFGEGTGTTVKDSSGKNNDGTLSGSGTTWATTPANNGAVALSGGYVKMPDGVLSGLSSITVSTNVYVDSANANPSWVYNFRTLKKPDWDGGDPGAHYMGLVLENSQYRTMLTTTRWTGEKTINSTSAFPKGVWKNVTYTQTGTTGTMYIDGVQVAQNNAVTITPDQIEATMANYIGKPAYDTDKYFTGKVSDFRVYSKALSSNEVQSIWIESLSDSDAVTAIKGLLDIGNVSGVISDLTLPASYCGAAIAWDSDNKAVIANDGKVTRAGTDTTVNLTATITRGSASDTKTFAVTVKKSGTVYALDSDSYSLYVDKTHKTVLTATKEDLSTKDVTADATFSSSDPTIATVDASGIVKGIKPGKAVISVTYSGKTYTANVTVNNSMVLWYKLDQTSGTTAKDSSGNGNDGTLKGGASWFSGGGVSLDGSSGYIQMPNGILSGISDVTVSTNVYVDADYSKPSWLFSFGSSTDPYNDGTANYFGLVLEPSRYRAVLATNHWSDEKSTTKASAFTTAVWKNITYTQSGKTGTLYVDGVQVAQNNDVSFTPDNIEATIANYIGKPAYTQDKYIKAKLKDFRLYKRALSSSEVQVLSGTSDEDVVAKDKAALTLGDTSAVKTNLVLPASGDNGSTITWASGDSSVVAETGSVNRPAAGSANAIVTLTATITRGAVSDTKVFNITVIRQSTDIEKVKEDTEALVVHNIGDVRGNLSLAEKGLNGSSIVWKSEAPDVVSTTGVVTRPSQDKSDVTVRLTATLTLNSVSVTKAFNAIVRKMPAKEDPNAYLFAYFIGEDKDNGEQMYFALSKGNDPLNWNNMNGGNPVFTSKLGTKGLRDPSIIRSPDGDKFYMIATDLKINGNNDWTAAQKTGSTSIMVWESTDLVNWSNQRLVKINTDLAGCTWAPEAFYDKTTGEYVVYWASKVYSDATKSGSPNQRIMYAKTRDFYTFTEPKELYNPGYSVIDSTSIEYNGKVYRFTKDERDYNAASAPHGKMVFEQVSDTFFGNFTTITEGIGTGSIPVGEGPLIFKANGENKWYLFIDYFSGGGYKVFYTTDLNLTSDTWHYVSSGYNMPDPAPRHGTVLPITQTEYEALSAKVPTEVAVSATGATQVILDKTSVSLNNGSQVQLNAVVGPDNASDKTVLWSSNNESVATVDAGGMVTAVTTGSAIITASTVSGAHIATCDVNVSDAQKGSIEGMVTDGTNPVDGALVSVAADGGIYSATTSSGGIFLIADIPEGTGYTVTASKNGYLQGSVLVNVTANTTTSAIIIAMTKENPPSEYVPPVSSSAGGTGTVQKAEDKIIVSDAGGKVTVSISTAPVVGADGSAKAFVTEGQINAAIKKALETKSDGTRAPAIEIQVQANTATSVSAAIPQSSVVAALQNGIGALNIKSKVADLNFDKSALETINKYANGNIVISVAPTAQTGISGQDTDRMDGKPAYSLSITTGADSISSLGDGKVWVSIPYDAKEGENADNIIVYSLSKTGSLTKVAHCAYDEATRTMKFMSKDLATFTLGSSINDFSDVSGWYADSVNYLSARGIINGKGNGQFAPNANITRAEFVSILANLAGADLSAYKASAFSDVGQSAWYNGAIQWAYDNGLISGFDGKFAPNSNITRQDIAVIIAKYADKIEKHELNKTNAAMDFSDDAQISAYAKTAVTQLQQAGIISGKGNNTFAPVSNATRAEAASMVTVLLRGIIK
jgi:GH43 family beta-xylosidase/uncharacterized protein YjdB/sucrose-6-phosphate hydrolase SacC (GH32 family)